MYCDFYQMRERPFSVTADPRFLYLNARYREALASLHYGVTQRKGFITLIGEAGTGKTTLLKKLLDDLDPSTRTVFIFNTNVTFDEILEYLFGEFDLPVHNAKRLYMLQRLNSFLLEELRSGRNVALLIDEAQDLDFAVLEELRLLSNLETAKEKILQIVLSGQPELGQKLGNPILRQLRQRVAVNCRLLPLTRQELTEYIQSRLTAAGCADPRLFSRDAEERIFEISTGIPRLINIVCDNALVIGYALGKKRIGVDVVNEAAADLVSMDTSDFSVEAGNLGVTVAAQPVPRARIISQIGVVAAVVVALLIGLLSVGRSLLRREFGLLAGGTVQQAPLEVVAPGARMDAREKVRLRPVAPGGSRVVAGEDDVGRGLQREAGGEGRAAEERQRGALGMAEYPVPLDREGNRQRPAIGMQGEAGADAEREPVVLEVARRVPGLAEGDVAEAAEPLVSLPLQGIEPSSAVRAAATEDAETAASVEMEAVGAPQHEETGEMAAAASIHSMTPLRPSSRPT